MEPNIKNIISNNIGKLVKIDYHNNSNYITINGIISDLNDTHMRLSEAFKERFADVFIPISTIYKISLLENDECLYKKEEKILKRD